MGFLIGILTVIMVLVCLLLTLLVLIQLPKKEAGMGVAFGAGATDALFGAGSGTALTKITKYTSVIFFVLSIVLSVLQSSYHNRRTTQFQENIGKAPPRVTGAATAPAAQTKVPISPGATNVGAVLTTPTVSSNVPLLNIPAATNAEAPKK
ncbi:MAG TPA: preprotein translocase subunit SecG [Verrucomicrobiae bacterium]|nr:preprotein translocase subunit SecG [Verrucomicrobiae bacterium]